MAKQLVNPLEQHVEKAVLGAAVLLLIGVVARFVVVSPNQLTLGGEPVTPGSIDNRVAQKADEVRRRIQSHAPDDQRLPEPLFDFFLRAINPPLPASLPQATRWAPPVPVVDPPETVAGATELVDVVPFVGGPAFTQGRSTLLFHWPDGSPRFRPANWITVSALFDAAAQRAEQQSKYGATRREVIYGLPELQRRYRQADGSWSEWEDIQPWPAAELPPAPSVQLVRDEDHYIVSRETHLDLDRFAERLSESQFQLDVIRPMMHEFVPGRGDEWAFPILTSRRDVLKQDDELMFPREPPADVPVDRYKDEEDAVRIGAQPAERSPAELLEESRRLLQEARNSRSEQLAIQAHNRAFDVEQSTRATASEKSAASLLVRQAKQLQDDIRRQRVFRGAGPGTPAKTADDDRPRRQLLPTQQIWAHDAQPERVASGRTYQYRIRATLYNRLAGQPAMFRDPTLAQQLFIKGPWSDPVTISVPVDTEFYVTSETRRNNEVSVEFFKWEDGVWVKSRRFRYTIGDVLQGQDRVQVPSVDDPTRPANVSVPFAADGKIIDIDFRRTYSERRIVRGGVRFGPVSEGTSVVFVDESGGLHERFVELDRSDPRLADARSRLWKPRASRDR